MHFHLPRRHRRRLLLPPGLLALAGLLLLGCLALRPWQERLGRKVVMQLTMPPINESRTIWPVEYFEACDSLLLKEPKLSYSNVLTYRSWTTISFGRGQCLDTLAIHEIKKYLHSNGPESRACYALAACRASIMQAKATKCNCCKVRLRRS